MNSYDKLVDVLSCKFNQGVLMGETLTRNNNLIFIFKVSALDKVTGIMKCTTISGVVYSFSLKTCNIQPGGLFIMKETWDYSPWKLRFFTRNYLIL